MNSAPVSPRSTRTAMAGATAPGGCRGDERRLRSPGAGFDRGPGTRVSGDALRKVIGAAGAVAARDA